MKKYALLFAFLATMASAVAQSIATDDTNVIDMTQFDTNGYGKVKDVEAALVIKDLYSIITVR